MDEYQAQKDDVEWEKDYRRDSTQDDLTVAMPAIIVIVCVSVVVIAVVVAFVAYVAGRIFNLW